MAIPLCTAYSLATFKDTNLGYVYTSIFIHELAKFCVRSGRQNTNYFILQWSLCTVRFLLVITYVYPIVYSIT